MGPILNVHLEANLVKMVAYNWYAFNGLVLGYMGCMTFLYLSEWQNSDVVLCVMILH